MSALYSVECSFVGVAAFRVLRVDFDFCCETGLLEFTIDWWLESLTTGLSSAVLWASLPPYNVLGISAVGFSWTSLIIVKCSDKTCLSSANSSGPVAMVFWSRLAINSVWLTILLVQPSNTSEDVPAPMLLTWAIVEPTIFLVEPRVAGYRLLKLV